MSGAVYSTNLDPPGGFSSGLIIPPSGGGGCGGGYYPYPAGPFSSIYDLLLVFALRQAAAADDDSALFFVDCLQRAVFSGSAQQIYTSILLQKV
jgi:hypothetical protein